MLPPGGVDKAHLVEAAAPTERELVAIEVHMPLHASKVGVTCGCVRRSMSL